MNIHKIILTICLTIVLVACEKKTNVESAPSETTANEQATKAEIQNKITDEEVEKLRLISEDPNALPAHAKLAETFLQSINGFKPEEIRELIAEYEESQYIEEYPVQEISMEYRVDTNSQYIGNQLVHTYYLNVLSLSDSIDVDRIEVNRGNCPIAFRGGPNPVGYGQSLKFLLDCNPQDIREVKVYLKDGGELLMTPK